MSFEGCKHSPSPDKYKIDSTFDFKESPSKTGAFNKPKKSFCFGAGREDFAKTVYNTNTMYPDAIVPGPGTYTDETTLIGVNARKTALKERKFYLDDEEMALKIGNLGQERIRTSRLNQKMAPISLHKWRAQKLRE